MNLYAFTFIVDFVALITSVWLGLYLVTRSPRSQIAWLTGFTLWSVAGWFLNVLFALNPPTSVELLPLWMRPLLWFWPEGTFEHGWGFWLQGWQITPAIMFFHHVTMLLRSGPMNAWRWVRVILGYVIAIAAIAGQRSTTLVFTTASGDPLYLTTLKQGPLYPYYMGALFTFTILCLVNLARSATESPTLLQRKQLNLLEVATMFAGLAAPVSFISYNLNFPLPRVVPVLLVAIAVFLIGYGVIRYSALAEGRVIRRDFIYNGFAMILVVALYLLVVWGSVMMYDVPFAAIAIVALLAIFTHSLVDVARSIFDLIFYRGETRELREKLRSLIREVSEPEALEESLSVALETLCKISGATYGTILLSRNGEARQFVSYRLGRLPGSLVSNDLKAEEWTRLARGKFPPPLEEAELLLPLYAGEKQHGALILGRPTNAMSYSDLDLERLLDASDRIAEAVHNARRENANLARIAQLAESSPPNLDMTGELPTSAVEDALRNLSDFTYLADTALARSPLAASRLPNGKVTHLERGKAVQQIVLDALGHLRPSPEIPRRDPLPREWYPYLILKDAYLEGVSNRDIMLKLYISEGTFNRTRRAAIRSLARALTEMEQPA